MVEHKFPNVAASETRTPGAPARQGRPYRTYFIQPVAAGCWIGINDLEFRADDDLSGDDVAQVLFNLTGGQVGRNGTAGQCSGYQVFYEPAKPAQLVLKPLHTAAAPAQPSLYYLA
jgi:hypothetical protein